MYDDQIKIIAWISSLDLEDARRIQRPMRTFLKGFQRVKKGGSPMRICRLAPCLKSQYSRGVCARHYQQLKAISRIVGWAPLAKLGLCRMSSLRDRAVTADQQKAKLRIPIKQLSPAEKRLLGITK